MTTPIQIRLGGYGPATTFKPDLLINLSETPPGSAEDYSRIAEIVTADEEVRSRSRQHFVHYRSGGHQMETHNL